MSDAPIRIDVDDVPPPLGGPDGRPVEAMGDRISTEREVEPGSVEVVAGDGAARVEAAFATAREEDRAALVIYLPAGYPDHDTSRACLEAAAEAGADVLEIGFPFSDPVMDGPIIQRANQDVLGRGATVADHLAMTTALTASIDVPALVMTYITIADAHGYDRFADELLASGAAGAILPDLPVTESDAWREQADARGLASVLLASSVSSDDRLAAIGEVSTGFVYAVGLLGVTGVKSVARDATAALVERIRPVTDLPIAVGIGVKDAADAAAVAGFADGVIVGSEAVRRVAEGDPAGAPQRVHDLVADLRRGCEG